MSESYDVLVLGAGPGGYVAAIRAAQLGRKVAVVEREEKLGGTCLRVGCIPSKALLESSELFYKAAKEFKVHGISATPELNLAAMHKRKDGIVRQLTNGVAGLFKKNGVEHVRGEGKLLDAGTVQAGDRTLTAKSIIIATGSVPVTLPGVELDGERIVTSTEALSFEEVPEKLVIIGGGVIGLEMGSVWSRLGSKVTVLEFLPRILPGMDDDLAKEAKKILGRQGMKIETGVRVTGAVNSGQAVTVTVEKEGDEKPMQWEADKLLVAVGRKAATSGIGLEELGIEPGPGGKIAVNENYETAIKGVYAIGDVIEGPMLAHKASEEGVAVAQIIAGGKGVVHYNALPGVAYTDPEIASVGKTEQQLQEAGVNYRSGKFPFMANGRAKALGSRDGFVKILVEEKTGLILGGHILGPRAGDLIQELVLAIQFGRTAQELGEAFHAHPSLSEAVKEAALDAIGEAVHQ